MSWLASGFRFCEVLDRPQARTFEGGIQLLAPGLKLLGAEVARYVCPLRPADADAGERLGYQKAVPGFHDPGTLGLEMKGADGRAGELRQLDGTHLGLINGAERAVG